MGDDLSDEFKLQTLWRSHEERSKKTTNIFGRDVKDLIIWGLLAATAGTNDNIQTLLGGLLK